MSESMKITLENPDPQNNLAKSAPALGCPAPKTKYFNGSNRLYFMGETGLMEFNPQEHIAQLTGDVSPYEAFEIRKQARLKQASQIVENLIFNPRRA